jgi:hypothetical protein
MRNYYKPLGVLPEVFVSVIVLSAFAALGALLWIAL